MNFSAALLPPWDWAQSPIPNPQSPIPNPQSPNANINILNFKKQEKKNLIKKITI
jgi:hypothetical protein